MTTNARTKNTRSAANGVLVALFLFGLCAPSIGLALGLDRGAAMGENRPPAPPPTLRDITRSPGTFLFQLKSYVQDNFGFRARLVRWHSRVCISVLRSSPSSRVLLGKEGWLFQADERVVEDYRCERPFTLAELDAWTAAFTERKNWLAARGIPYIVMFAPNAHTIYPEFLPDSVNRYGARSRLDQLTESLRNSGVRVVDPRDALLGAKPDERLYHKTDTHWNDRGAFVACRALLEEIREVVPRVRAMDRGLFMDIDQDASGGDLAGQVGLADLLRERWLRLVPVSPPKAVFTPSLESQSGHFRVRSDPHHVSVIDGNELPAIAGAKPPRAVVFRDSFGTAMMPYIAEHFSRVRFEWVAEGFVPGIVEEERPDVVVQEITERFLMRLPPAAMSRVD